MKRIKIAQIGTGHDHACNAIQSLGCMSDIFELVGYCKVKGDDFDFPKFYDDVKELTIDEILENPDIEAVAVETYDGRLTEYALKAAKKGKAVFMDKPGSCSQSEFEELVGIVKKKNLPFFMGYMYRYNPAVMKLFEDIKAGKLGEIYSIEAHMSCLHLVEKRNWMADFKGGMLYFLGCHLIDIIYRIQGEPKNIIPLSRKTGIDGVLGEDFGMVAFEYENGVSFAKTCDVESGGFARRQIVVCGSKGTVEINPIEKYLPKEEIKDGLNIVTGVSEMYFDEAMKLGWDAERHCYLTQPFNRYYKMFGEFAKAVRGEKSNPYTPDYEAKLHRLILKACGAE